ncbi:phosphatase PAP2 family protein [Micromonospora sp. KC606]|uniref:carbohydrate binding domain-containing protein n=1 Tax=Micromonospora sp. KC606 TaxID=2530379 RepID=UPI00104D162B|nr:carbohydrate binding domain-containing protein [Micromonospora sp. KC606]TDC85809.1 phosphatase PAP2 family protein [Micromonospora sp. KC606]
MPHPTSARPVRRATRHALTGLLALILTLAGALVAPPATAATVEPPPGTELIKNGTFGNGITEPWWTRLAETQTSVVDGQLQIRTAGRATRVWDDVVGHFDFGITAGRSYRVAFDASANLNRPMRVTVSRVDSPYTSAFDRTVELTGTTRRFSFEFTAPFGDPKAVLLLHLGASPASTVRVDNVSLVPLAPNPAADPVLFWNGVLLDTFRAVDEPPTSLSRIAAIMHTAMHDAAVSVTGTGQPYRMRVPVHYPGTLEDVVAPSLEAAINQAAHDSLRALFTGRSFGSALATATDRLPSGLNADEVERGRAVGSQAAAGNVDARRADGSADGSPYVPDGVPGSWRPTGSGAAVTPNWGRVTPFTLTSPAQFRPGLPGGFGSYAALLGSQLYEDQVTEVRLLGGRTGSTRTAEQTQIAFFWANDIAGTYKPPGQLLAHTRIVAEQRNLTVLQNARLFGLVSLALADAAIVAWGSKYATPIDLWRPESAIHHADTDGRPGTQPDPSWRPLSQDRAGQSFSPAFPAYASGHATFAGAWAGVLRSYFGTDAIPFTGTTDDPNAAGVRRSFGSFTQAARENARSRIYLGVHFQFDADAGITAGLAVGAHVYANHLRG